MNPWYLSMECLLGVPHYTRESEGELFFLSIRFYLCRASNLTEEKALKGGGEVQRIINC